jgi:hypothetical protein
VPTGWLVLIALGLTVLAPPAAGPHTLPGFPQVQLSRVEPGIEGGLGRRLTVEVRDPAGIVPIPDAAVTVRARHADLGSRLRVEPVPLAPTGEPGMYRGEVQFPGGGPWELTVDVVGRFVGDAHFTLEVAGMAPPSAWRKPNLPFDAPMLRHLAMEWGHLAGFALWLAATAVGLVEPGRRRGLVLAATWAAFAIEGGTGLYKMEYGTPFATPLQLFRWDRVPRVFFADDYVTTLAIKHALMVAAMAVTTILTVHAWRTKPGAGIRLWRALLGVNGLLSLAIAGAAAVLGMYHAIVLHFS